MQHTMAELDSLFPNNVRILDAAIKTEDHLNTEATILVSISGGSDSDIMADMIERLGYEGKVIYVWFDTGLEYAATKRHIEFLEEKYHIKIIAKKAKKPIPVSCKEYGLPFLSKRVSEYISRLQKHGFQWEDEPLDVLMGKYKNCKAALRWWCNDFVTKTGKKSQTNINTNKWLKEFMTENPPDFLISNKCCHGAKKAPAREFEKEVGADLNVLGVRQAEGGSRATAYSTCFTSAHDDVVAQFRPLFYLSDADKREYEEHCEVCHSDCYTKYGLIRTGCACCPFGSRFEMELMAAEWFEPKLHKAANAIFGKSYEYTRKFRLFKKRMKWECKPKDENQLEMEW